MSSDQKRVHERVPVQFDVAFIHAGEATDGVGLNLSQRGMFIVTGRPVLPGEEAVLDFTPPGRSHPLSIRARVAWVGTPKAEPDATTGFGVQFLVYMLTPSQMLR